MSHTLKQSIVAALSHVSLEQAFANDWRVPDRPEYLEESPSGQTAYANVRARERSIYHSNGSIVSTALLEIHSIAEGYFDKDINGGHALLAVDILINAATQPLLSTRWRTIAMENLRMMSLTSITSETFAKRSEIVRLAASLSRDAEGAIIEAGLEYLLFYYGALRSAMDHVKQKDINDMDLHSYVAHGLTQVPSDRYATVKTILRLMQKNNLLPHQGSATPNNCPSTFHPGASSAVP